VVRNTEIILDLLAERGTAATFFVLGWVAERHPELVRRIAAAGHEVGSHSWWHYRVTRIDRSTFRTEVRSSKQALEDLVGAPVLGFRAPSFSIVPGLEWAFDELIEAGYVYDSSVFPIRRPGYGYPSAPRWPYSIARSGGTLLELPVATLALGPVRIPAAGGGYLRQIPFDLIRGAFGQAQRRGGPGVFYVHPWEVDVDQPRLPVGPLTRIRHYRNLDRTLPRMRQLLAEFEFTSIARWLADRPPVAA
jgi:polysaccharide deacetylase family protein (PEP-CTERM system associated)